MLARRTLLTAAAVLGLTQQAVAQDYPSRPIKLVVPFGAGTTADIVARVFGEGIAQQMGQPVVVENRAGAGGNIGVETVARASADGYTILLGTVGTHAINPVLYRKPTTDALKDFAPIGFAGSTPTLLIVSASSPYKTLKDLRNAASGGKSLSFASAGNGTSGHLAGELLKVRLGGDMVHVPYKAGARCGTFRPDGVDDALRSSKNPSCHPGEDAGRDLMIEGTRAKLVALGLDVPLMDERQLAQFSKAEVEKWSEIVRLSGAHID